MHQKLRQFFKDHGWISATLAASAVVRLWYVFQPLIVWWDSAIYIGMGKFLFTGGSIGVWENFRPPLMPLVLGIIWKLGLDPVVWGKLLMVLSSIFEIYIVYLIGKKLNERTGILAAILLSFSAVFITYANSPLSDIPAVLFSTLAIYYILEERYWLTGLSIAVAFYFRFPEALILFPILIYIFCLKYLDKKDLLLVFKKIVTVCAGFMIPLIPYFLINYFIFHDPLLPLTLAEKVASDPVNAHGRDILFYPYNLLLENIFLIFFPLILIPLFSRRKQDFKKPALLVVLSLIIVGLYFEFNTHVELRYSIAFLPFLAVSAAFGIDCILEFLSGFKYSKYVSSVAYVFIALVLLVICHAGYEHYAPVYAMKPDLASYLNYFKNIPGAKIITSSPETMAYTDPVIIQATDTWESALSAYTRAGNQVEYIALNTCALACENAETCPDTKKRALAYLAKLKRVFSGSSYVCDLGIYKPQ